jgi:hypothetical protein
MVEIRKKKGDRMQTKPCSDRRHHEVFASSESITQRRLTSDSTRPCGHLRNPPQRKESPRTSDLKKRRKEHTVFSKDIALEILSTQT